MKAYHSVIVSLIEASHIQHIQVDLLNTFRYKCLDYSKKSLEEEKNMI